MRVSLLALLALLSLAACKERFVWRQKITVTVETPSGEVSGSAVSEVEVISLPKTLPDAGVVDARLRGEAIAVEVTPGHCLFVLLDGGLGWAQDAYDKNQVGSVFEENMRFIIAQEGGPPVSLPADDLPMMVTFDDISDPTTVRLVEPDDLTGTFGPGVRLKGLILEITDEAITEGRVERLLAWLGSYPEPALGPATGGTSNIPFYRLVHMGDFIRK